MSHEDLSRDYVVRAGSERSFGLVIAAVLTCVALLPLRRGATIHFVPLAVALVLATLALIAPKTLRPLNQLWFKLGMVLHKVTNPLVMGILFFGLILPVSVIFRLSGKDPLNRSFDKRARSYWLMRSASEGDAIDMRRQF
jgi:hypothetical protein